MGHVPGKGMEVGKVTSWRERVVLGVLGMRWEVRQGRWVGLDCERL